MESENNQTIICHKCNRLIQTPNFQLHQLRCTGRNQNRQIFHNLSSTKSKNIFSNQKQKPVIIKNIKKQNLIAQDQEKIPCPFCGYLQNLSQLDTHPSQCTHRQELCSMCQQRFPRTLMREHQAVCTARNNDEVEQQEQEHIFSNHHRHHHHHRQRPFGERLRHSQQEEGHLAFYPPSYRFRNFGSIHSIDPQNRQSISFRMNGMTHNFETLIEIIQMMAARGNHNHNKGLTEQQISNLHQQVYKQKLQQDRQQCVICCCQLANNQRILKLPCKHVYHPSCIIQWLKKNSLCPVCKRDVKEQIN